MIVVVAAQNIGSGSEVAEVVCANSSNAHVNADVYVGAINCKIRNLNKLCRIKHFKIKITLMTEISYKDNICHCGST
jgi:hypothetical protein